MDRSFDLLAYKPSLWQSIRAPCQGTEIAATPNGPELQELATALAWQTKLISRHPYNPQNWIMRAKTLEKLQYPELVVGDAHKAVLLCGYLATQARHSSQWRLGYGMDFWMSDDQTSSDDETEKIQSHILHIRHQAEELWSNHLPRGPHLASEGLYFQRKYPWMEPRHGGRDEGLISAINEEFQTKAPKGKTPCCVLRRDAVGDAGSEAIGVFATRGITAKSTILMDKTQVWGCTGPGVGKSPRKIEYGCANPMHPNITGEDTPNLGWIRDELGGDAAEAIMRCRLLFYCLRDGVSHPLDHPLVARLTPNYYQLQPGRFQADYDIELPVSWLQRCGMDIFAAITKQNYDTWVLFTLWARISNNSWSDPIHTGLQPLFSFFNHSCEPNASWSVVPHDHTTLHVVAARDISAGDQIFIHYAGYNSDDMCQVRRKTLRRWFGGDCLCTRCVREEKEARLEDPKTPTTTSSSWDLGPKPVFPEDLVGSSWC
ncbi:hypothetical protein K470DRAFT_221698 [Piedraia hortae CBS 480.64]|uniref:SET domain-containing protein n=1 Tax=Piedraia hortae CBS 480.64 TaxID=1314780 RepID=A0A6A7BUM2_9PEZI|nr:hypothetical protein K470DRAFT_221698 [Piedraia hortae CBS 480.64]